MFENQLISIQKHCASCGELFALESPRQSYCKKCQYPTCQQCGKEFKRIRGNVNRYCSKKCYYASGKVGKKPIILTCEYCGKKFQKKAGYNRKKYCSKKCRYTAAQVADSSERRNHKYKKWRRDVLERDNFTCQHCGSPKRLQAHHIKEWAKFPKLRYKVENGLTLCTKCHTIEHNGKPTGSPQKIVNCEVCNKRLSGRGKSNLCHPCAMKKLGKQRKDESFRNRDGMGRFI